MATPAAFLKEAESELGYTESPAGSNKTKFAQEAGHTNGLPWCATFIVAVARRVGLALPSESAYTPTMWNAFRAAGLATTTPRRGDLAFFDFPDSKDRVQHVGIVQSVQTNWVTCIEGNTSAGTGGSQDNGGGVYRRTRPRKYVVGFGRPNFTQEDSMTPAQEKAINDRLAALEQRIDRGLASLEKRLAETHLPVLHNYLEKILVEVREIRASGSDDGVVATRVIELVELLAQALRDE